MAIFLGTQRKMLQRLYKHFLGDIGYSPSFRWILGLRASAGAVYLNFLAVKRSRLRGPPVCRIPHCIAESPEIFQLKTLQNRLEMGSNQHSCDLFRRKSCSSVRVKKDVLCPAGWLEQRSISILEMQTPNFHNSDGGSIPRHLTVRWNLLWIFILTQLHSAS